MKIGIIGTDTSHSVAFTELLNDKAHPYHVEGGQVITAFPGGSANFELSISRVTGYAEDLKQRFGVRLAERPEEVAEECDAILLLSADGYVHRELFEKIVPFGKPVFIDKPLANSLEEARVIAQLAQEAAVPVMSTSALRYAEAITQYLNTNNERITNVECFGPMYMEPTQKGYFWYGIHLVEMMFTLMGPDCRSVRATSSGDLEIISGVWKDGRSGMLKGSRSGELPFVASVHGEQNSAFITVNSADKPFYASLLEQVMSLFQTGVPAVPMDVTLQVIRFIEAANESKKTGKTIYL